MVSILLAVVLGWSVPAPASRAVVPVSATVCGASRCATVRDVGLQLSAYGLTVRPPKAAPFYLVRFNLPENFGYAGYKNAIPGIVYLPEKAIWRVRVSGVPLWFDVPARIHAELAPVLRRLRACPRSGRWVCRRG